MVNYIRAINYLILIICLSEGEGYNFTVRAWSTNRYRRQTSCAPAEHVCDNGQCINDTSLCDGEYDCVDHSDETLKCKESKCPHYLHTCRYGACISVDKLCNGHNDCADGSDEKNCIPGVFECYNGIRINDTEMCDGIAQCQDESDEINEQCGNFPCPEYNFKCNYGACINKELKCNGEKNCVDNSDEVGCIRPPLTKSVNIASKIDSGGCRLPNYPENGKWSPVSLEFARPGQEVREGTVIKFECEIGYKVDPYHLSECIKSKWDKLPKCRKTCKTRIPPTGLKITCTLNGSNTSCIDPYIGTIARMECPKFYKDPSLAERPDHYCLNNGQWEYELPTCEPECGHTSVQPKPFVIGGNFSKAGEYPWQVAIYLDESQNCGGSIISPNVILSAAHCFEESELKRYKVGAGKLYRSFNDNRDKYAQYSNVQELYIHSNYDDQFRGDIAVLILETPFNISTYVRPICFNANEIDEDELLKDEVCVVTGWGYTSEEGNSSDVLKELNVNFFQRQHCRKKISSDFYESYSLDKICAGVPEKDESVCQGDSGGPLAIKHNGLYYIRGIVSVGAIKLNQFCDSTSLALYTSVNYYRTYINNLVRKYRIQL